MGACVVKIADKISYLGRDIEDAITLGILDSNLDELYNLLGYNYPHDKINNTIIINNLVKDLCENSSPEKGLCFSDSAFQLMNEINKFNYKNIYNCKRIIPSNRYFDIVLNEIYSLLKSTFSRNNTISAVKNIEKFYPKLSHTFLEFLMNYYDFGNRETLKLKNKILFDKENNIDFYKAILYYISGMTDNFAIEIYNEIIGF